jgi:hypothetical protein
VLTADTQRTAEVSKRGERGHVCNRVRELGEENFLGGGLITAVKEIQ